MAPQRLEPFFNPRSIAVFGASASGTSVGSMVFANLLAGGFRGDVVPINPKHDEVAGRRCYAAIGAVTSDIDLAVIATPPAAVPQIIRECGENGVRHAVILSAGFREAGSEGLALEQELKEAARRAGVRFVGPHCVGLVRPWIGMNATFPKSEAPKGRLALVSQSGALCSAISDWATPHHLGFSALVSLGNSTDASFGVRQSWRRRLWSGRPEPDCDTAGSSSLQPRKEYACFRCLCFCSAAFGSLLISVGNGRSTP